MAKTQHQFQYFTKSHLKNGTIEESTQLYFDFHLWCRKRSDYWGCTKCRTYISTQGDEFKFKDKSLPTKDSHFLTSPDEFKIKKHLELIKKMCCY